jgi:hypothetical protein
MNPFSASGFVTELQQPLVAKIGLVFSLAFPKLVRVRAGVWRLHVDRFDLFFLAISPWNSRDGLVWGLAVCCQRFSHHVANRESSMTPYPFAIYQTRNVHNILFHHNRNTLPLSVITIQPYTWPANSPTLEQPLARKLDFSCGFTGFESTLRYANALPFGQLELVFVRRPWAGAVVGKVYAGWNGEAVSSPLAYERGEVVPRVSGQRYLSQWERA